MRKFNIIFKSEFEKLIFKLIIIRCNKAKHLIILNEFLIQNIIKILKKLI